MSIKSINNNICLLLCLFQIMFHILLFFFFFLNANENISFTTIYHCGRELRRRRWISVYEDAKWWVVDTVGFALLIMAAARVADDSRTPDFGGITGWRTGLFFGIGGGAPRPLLLFTGFTFACRLLFWIFWLNKGQRLIWICK